MAGRSHPVSRPVNAMPRNKNTEEFSNTAVVEEPEASDEKDERRQVGNQDDDAKLAKGKDDDRQQSNDDADDRQQAKGKDDDRDTASGRREASDLKQSLDVAGIEGRPDYKDIIATRLTEDHPKTAEAFREGRIMDYSSDRNLAGIRGGKMETEVRHVVGAVTEVSKGASDQERWQISAAAADQMLARQSIADDKREAQAAYSGSGGDQNQYQSVFEKMTDRQQGQLSWYKQQIVTFTDKAADPAQPEYTEKEAAKDVRRMMRDANQFLIQENVIDKKGNLLNGNGRQDSGIQQNADNRQAGSTQQNNGAQQATGSQQAADNSQATGNQQNGYNSQKAQEIDVAMGKILNGQNSPEHEQKLTQNYIWALGGKPTDDATDRYRNAVYEATVANYRDPIINNFANDRPAYEETRNELIQAGHISRLVQGEQFQPTVDASNFADYGADGIQMQYLRQMAGSPDDSAGARLQNTLLDNIAEQVREGTNDYEKVGAYAATVMGIQNLRDQQEAYQGIYEAVSNSGPSRFDAAALNEITPAYIERTMQQGQTDLENNFASDAAVAALTPIAYQAALTGKPQALEAVKEQAKIEATYLAGEPIVKRGWAPDPTYSGSESRVAMGIEHMDLVINGGISASTGTNGEILDYGKPGDITALQIARDEKRELEQHLAAGQYDLPHELQLKTTFVMRRT